MGLRWLLFIRITQYLSKTFFYISVIVKHLKTSTKYKRYENKRLEGKFVPEFRGVCALLVVGSRQGFYGKSKLMEQGRTRESTPS